MSSLTGRCFVCGRYLANLVSASDEWRVECQKCGTYVMRRSIQEDLATNPASRDLLPYLAAHIRQSSSGGAPCDVGSNWEELARLHADSTIYQKVRLLLEFIAHRSRIGETYSIWLEELSPYIDAKDTSETVYLLSYLQEMGHIRHELKTIGWPRSKHKEGQEATILMKVQGWEALSPVAGTAVAGKCFVAMSFDPSLTSAYEQGMIPAIVQDCKFSVERLDRVEHNESINDRILAGIRGSQFTVADFTFQRPNVYFEAGFALALGRTVIWTCRETDAENLQFDTRQMNYIRWADPQDLRSKLTPRILATVALPFRAAQR